jgi:bacitracin synthase 3
VFALYSSLAFDLTVTSIFTPLIGAGSIQVFDDEVAGPQLIQQVFRHPMPTVIKLTPSHLRVALETQTRPPGLRTLILGGESLDTNLAGEAQRMFGPEVVIMNEYGPTEATVGCMVHRYQSEGDREAAVPIGRPAANSRIYVLDELQQTVPEGGVGELYIGGEGLAEGYWNRPELTTEVFKEHSLEPKGKLYRTGDLAKWTPEYGLSYLGRLDNQVKLNGHRLELSEVRNLLNRHPEIRDSIVRVLKNQRGVDVLVAYYVARNALDDGELYQFLAKSLSPEVIPSVYAHLQRLPLTMNGKVDARALPAWEEIQRHTGGARSRPPQSQAEQVMAGIWMKLLQTTRVGVTDRFFQLGGHSLLGMQLMSRIEHTFGTTLPIATLFSHPTIEGLIGELELKLGGRNIVEEIARTVLEVESASPEIVTASLHDTR